MVAASCLVAMLLASALPPARGQGTPASRPDDDARARFKQVADAYKALAAYSDEGQFVVALTIGGKPRREARPLRLAFARPNKLDLDAGSVRLISDGKTLATVVRPLKKYTTAPAPATIGIDTFREGPTGPLLFGGPTGAPTFLLLNLLSGTDPDACLKDMGATLRAEGDAILIDLREGPDLLLRVDPATRLLSAIDLNFVPARPVDGPTPSIERFGWTAGAIATRPPDDRAFAFVAPEGFTRIADLKARAGEAAGSKYAVEETIGQPAPDFRLTLLDGPGKTKEVAKRDLAGKVVLIDFWATWCGPCIVELPEIKKLVDRYNATKQDVLVVALSQDMLPEELPALRARREGPGRQGDRSDRRPGRPDRAGSEQCRGPGVQHRGVPLGGDPRPQGDRPIGLRRLPLRHRSPAAPVAGQGDRRDPRGQVTPPSRLAFVAPRCDNPSLRSSCRGQPSEARVDDPLGRPNPESPPWPTPAATCSSA